MTSFGPTLIYFSPTYLSWSATVGVLADVGLGSLSVDVVSLTVDVGCMCSVLGDVTPLLPAAHAVHALLLLLLQFCGMGCEFDVRATAAEFVAYWEATGDLLLRGLVLRMTDVYCESGLVSSCGVTGAL